MLGRPDHVGGRGGRGENVVEAQQCGDDPLDGAVDIVPRRFAPLERAQEVLGPHHPVGHLDVEAGGHRRRGVAQAEDPVADDEALEPPLAPQDAGEQRRGSARTTRR